MKNSGISGLKKNPEIPEFRNSGIAITMCVYVYYSTPVNECLRVNECVLVRMFLSIPVIVFMRFGTLLIEDFPLSIIYTLCLIYPFKSYISSTCIFFLFFSSYLS